MSAALEADLHLLSALSGLDDDIEGLLRAMVDDLKAAVPSAVGLTLTVHMNGQDVTLTTLDDENSTSVGASILVPLGVAPGEGTCIVFYAETPGAFVDLSADLGWTTGLSAEMILLDQHLLLPVEGSAVSGMRELSTINQAIGMLIEQGSTPESARMKLDRLAESQGTTSNAAAAEIISAVRSGRPVA